MSESKQDCTNIKQEYDTVIKLLDNMFGFTHEICKVLVQPAAGKIELESCYGEYTLHIYIDEPSRIYITVGKLSELGKRILNQMPLELINKIATTYELKVHTLGSKLYFHLREVLGKGRNINRFVYELCSVIEKVESYILNDITDEMINAYIVSRDISDKDEKQ